MAKTKSVPSVYRKQLEDLAEAAFLEAAQRRDESESLKRKARQLRAVAKGIDDGDPGPAGSIGYRRSRAKVVIDSAFRRALGKRGLSVPDWARRQRNPALGVEVAKGWLKLKGRPRPCPEFWAERIAAEFIDEHGRSEVPAVDTSWPHGIKRG